MFLDDREGGFQVSGSKEIQDVKTIFVCRRDSLLSYQLI